jgi:hypothetical protein
MSALSFKNLYTVLSFLQMPITVSFSSSADGAALLTTIPYKNKKKLNTKYFACKTYSKK